MVGIVMFGLIKNFIGMGEEKTVPGRGELVNALEQSAFNEDRCFDAVDNASRLRNLLRKESSSLTHDERVRIVKALNKAKVRALMQGTTEAYSAFKSLDSISNDVVHLL
jgi:hypothetical protein